jgi:hypothetical protein
VMGCVCVCVCVCVWGGGIPSLFGVWAVGQTPLFGSGHG